MDAGVPLKAPVAGIAMGLIKEGEKYKILTDILGDEDHLGDMDFKLAGTADGITAIQMDMKIAGISEEIFRLALDQARKLVFIFWVKWQRPSLLSVQASKLVFLRSSLSKLLQIKLVLLSVLVEKTSRPSGKLQSYYGCSGRRNC